MTARARLWLCRSFSATHRIVIDGELEPVHGHEFKLEVEVDVLEGAGGDAPDAAQLSPIVDAVLAPLAGTDLRAAAATAREHPSAERIAAYLFRRLQQALSAEPGLRLARSTVHEAIGCTASYRESRPERIER